MPVLSREKKTPLKLHFWCLNFYVTHQRSVPFCLPLNLRYIWEKKTIIFCTNTLPASTQGSGCWFWICSDYLNPCNQLIPMRNREALSMITSRGRRFGSTHRRGSTGPAASRGTHTHIPWRGDARGSWLTSTPRFTPIRTCSRALCACALQCAQHALHRLPWHMLAHPVTRARAPHIGRMCSPVGPRHTSPSVRGGKNSEHVR